MSYSIEQTDAQLRRTSAAIRYHLSFPQAAQHLLHVRMEIDTNASEIVLALPSWIPGSYKIRDFVTNLADLSAATTRGRSLPHEWIARNRIRVETGGASTVVVSYIYFGNERTVRQTHINRFHAFVNPANCLLYVEGRTGEVHHVAVEHDWKHCSTALSPVRKDVVGALNYDILVDSPMEIGDHFVAAFEAHGATHDVAVTGAGDFEPDWIVQQLRTIVDTAVGMWRELPYDRYVFIVQLVPGQFGGLEHSRCSVNLFDAFAFSERDKVARFLGLLCHEYFHLWNVKRIRPVELGPFDYDKEQYTRMLWLAEGLTSYYDDLMAYRCGFITRAEYLQTLGKDRLNRLLDVPGRLSTSVKDSSYLAWVKLYAPTPDSDNQYPSYYLKGGVIFLLLDLWIVARTDGAHTLDDGMRALMARYHSEPATGLTEDEFIATVSGAVTVDVGPLLRAWLNGTEELPVEEIVAEVGLKWAPKPQKNEPFGDNREYIDHPMDRWLGLGFEEIKTGLKIRSVRRESPAEEAGIGADDELLAIDGVRVTTMKEAAAMIRGHRGGRMEITAAAEGRLYTVRLKPGRRPPFELVEDEGASEARKALLDRWLQR